MNNIVRVVKNGIAHGNHNGRPFDYHIKEETLIMVDPQGKPRSVQDYAERFSLELYLRNYFSVEASEHRHNIARNNGE